MRSDMNTKAKRLPKEKVRLIIVAVAVSLLMIFAILNFVSRLVEYNEIQAEKQSLENQLADKKDSIEELEYWIAAPMDDKYIMKFAKEKLELYRADEIVFTNDQNK